MFSEKLRFLMERMDAGSTLLGQYAGSDRTNISRFRSGVRVPQPGGASAARLAEGFCRLAADTGRLSELREITGAPADAGGARLRDSVLCYLFELSPGELQGGSGRSRRTSGPRGEGASFGSRLDAAMELCGITNARMSRLVSTDASLISRYRSGARVPLGNPGLIDAMCQVIYRQMLLREKEEEFSRLLRLPPDEIDGNAVRDWLCGCGDAAGGEAIGRLLTRLEALNLPAPAPAEDSGTENTARLTERVRPFVPCVLYGTDGIREAVRCFLCDALRTEVRELCLYSDEKMDWMVGDRNFFADWSALMAACVRSGIRIRIVHNADRDLGEMISAIEGWLPLYLSGQIEPYFCKKSVGERFSHTLFLSPGRACVTGFHIRGGEKNGLYRCVTDPGELEQAEAEYALLLESCRPLVRVTDGKELRNVNADVWVGPVPSLGTMPEETVRAFGSPELYAEWGYRRSALLSAAEKGGVVEYAPILPDPAKAAGLPVDSAMADLRYTPELYAAHVRGIGQLLESCPGYRLYPLSVPAFSNMSICCEESCVSVIRNGSPRMAFTFSHPLMRRAFRTYADRLDAPRKEDRDAVTARLREYALH